MALGPKLEIQAETAAVDAGALLGPARRGASLRQRQGLIITLLFGGYAACYFCRADLSVATPLLANELAARGLPYREAIIRLGTLTSAGVLAYALGKFFLTGLGDFWGGRRNFFIGVGGAAVFTLLFALAGGLPLFTVAWIGNRLTQSLGWAGLVKVSSKWFDFSSYGTVIGFLSLSYLIGDAVAREWMGALIAHGYGWRTLFLLAAAVAGVFFLANVFWLRESRAEFGYPEAKPNPLSLFAATEARPRNLRELLLPLVRSKAFILVCLLSLGCTIIRETFNSWTPLYLHDGLGYTMGSAAGLSAIFPALGAVSVLATGWLSDRCGANGRPLIMFLGLAASTAVLIAMMSLKPGANASMLPLVAIGAIAFCLLGPYSFLGGAFALDFGGKQAGAVSSGIIDGVGYLGAVFAGDSVARLAVDFGWKGVFVALAVVSALAAMAAGALLAIGTRAARRARA